MKRFAIATVLSLGLIGGTDASAQIAEGRNDVFTDFLFQTQKLTDDAGDRETFFSWTTSYARLVTDRLGVGPLFRIAKNPHQDATGYLGGLVRYHFGDLDGGAVPFAEFNFSRTLGEESDFFDIQAMGGVVFPMGRSGGRFRVAPYYYRQFLDEDETGEEWFKSWGVTFGAGLLF